MQQKLMGSHLVKKFPTLYWTWKFIMAFTRASNRSVSRTRWIQSAPFRPYSLGHILIISFHLLVGLPSGPFYSGFPPETVYDFLLSGMFATWPVPLIHLDLITPITWVAFSNHETSDCKVFSSLLLVILFGLKCFPQYPVLEHPQLVFFN